VKKYTNFGEDRMILASVV